jgi:cytidine deaminase
MPTHDKERLIKAASEARRFAVAPYSQFAVGAALLTNSGEIIMGANVESVSYGLTCCAERVALFKALTDGFRDFRAIAIVAPIAATPCGACRQLLAEYASEAVVWIAAADDRRVWRNITFVICCRMDFCFWAGIPI